MIRDVAGLTGTKFGCGVAQCGACTVHVDGMAQRSCVTPIEAVAGSDVVTIEGISGPEAEAVQKAWVSIEVPQCGYCQSGQIMSAVNLLQFSPQADRRRDQRRDGREHLPLRHLSPHPAAVHEAAKTLEG